MLEGYFICDSGVDVTFLTEPVFKPLVLPTPRAAENWMWCTVECGRFSWNFLGHLTSFFGNVGGFQSGAFPREEISKIGAAHDPNHWDSPPPLPKKNVWNPGKWKVEDRPEANHNREQNSHFRTRTFRWILDNIFSSFCVVYIESTPCPEGPEFCYGKLCYENFLAWELGFPKPSGCRKRSAAKGVRSLFFVFGTLSVTFRSLFLMLLSLFSSLFCQTPFAGLLLPDSFCGRVKLPGCFKLGCSQFFSWKRSIGGPLKST